MNTFFGRGTSCNFQHRKRTEKPQSACDCRCFACTIVVFIEPCFAGRYQSCTLNVLNRPRPNTVQGHRAILDKRCYLASHERRHNPPQLCHPTIIYVFVTSLSLCQRCESGCQTKVCVSDVMNTYRQHNALQHIAVKVAMRLNQRILQVMLRITQLLRCPAAPVTNSHAAICCRHDVAYTLSKEPNNKQCCTQHTTPLQPTQPSTHEPLVAHAPSRCPGAACVLVCSQCAHGPCYLCCSQTSRVCASSRSCHHDQGSPHEHEHHGTPAATTVQQHHGQSHAGSRSLMTNYHHMPPSTCLSNREC